ncbi:MAG: acetylglutamate kinase [Verrucomicrobia bacterium 61-8]|nr:acetylglutamate kinase [Verrucomicrobiota bacterium]OJV00282.1 MAG: acetylglutamate kinase [Verrucomicrobia bacterium 61-8]
MSSQLSPEARSETLIEALPFIQKFRGQTFVIKYGGAAMEEEQIVERFLRDVVFLEAVGINPVLVHGGGKAITARMREAGLKAQFINGLRVTDAQSIKIVEQTLDGVINPHIVDVINQYGGKARGFSGKDVFVARKMGLQRIDSGEEVDIGFVGEAAKINPEAVSDCIHQEVVPVISPIGADADGVVLNINADIAAAALATALKAAKLIYVSDVPGIMRDPSDKESLIPSIQASQIDTLIKQKVIDGGMIPKVQSAAAALTNGVGKVHMIGGHIQHCLLLEIFTSDGIGTELIR